MLHSFIRYATLRDHAQNPNEVGTVAMVSGAVSTHTPTVNRSGTEFYHTVLTVRSYDINDNVDIWYVSPMYKVILAVVSYLLRPYL